MPRSSIRTRLVLLVIVLVTLFYSCFSIYLYAGFEAYLYHALSATLVRRAHQIATTIVSKVPQRGESYVGSEIEARFAPEINDRLIRVITDKNRVVYASANAKDLPPASFAPGSVPPGTPVAKELNGAGGLRFETTAVTISTSAGLFQVEVGSPETQIRLELRSLTTMLSLGFPFFLTAASFGAYVLVGRALRPVDEIVASAELITGKNLSKRLPVPSTGDEVERLSVGLNRMIGRLEMAFQQTTRFSADASHELRTPLTIVKGEVESLLTDESLLPQQKDQLRSVLEETERLTQIVQGLLLMSRLEGGDFQANKTDLDLSTLVQSTVDQLELMAEQEGLSLVASVEPRIKVSGDQIRLQQVVLNLVDNAIKYTQRGGQISVALQERGNFVSLTVEDNGVGISPEALPHVFDRFYRSPQADASKKVGTGLGLSIVKTIVESHQGTITLESQEGRGTFVEVRLPTTS